MKWKKKKKKIKKRTNSRVLDFVATKSRWLSTLIFAFRPAISPRLPFSELHYTIAIIHKKNKNWGKIK